MEYPSYRVYTGPIATENMNLFRIHPSIHVVHHLQFNSADRRSLKPQCRGSVSCLFRIIHPPTRLPTPRKSQVPKPCLDQISDNKAPFYQAPKAKGPRRLGRGCRLHNQCEAYHVFSRTSSCATAIMIIFWKINREREIIQTCK